MEDGTVLEYGDLLSILPRSDGQKTIIDWTNYCVSQYKGRYCRYHLWELAVKHYLTAKGWSEIGFVDGERDSFGSLTRVMWGKDPSGKQRRMVYG